MLAWARAEARMPRNEVSTEARGSTKHMGLRSLLTTSALVVSGLALLLAPACGANNSGGFFNDGGSGSGSGGSGSGGSSSGTAPIFGTDAAVPDTGGGGCVGLQCQQHSCSGGGTTTITGHVYDPAGNNPLYKVVVYVPNTIPLPITDGINCRLVLVRLALHRQPDRGRDHRPDRRLHAHERPGRLEHPDRRPDRQVAKLLHHPERHGVRRERPDTLLPAKLTLPKTQNETQFSNIPNIAVSTGGADTLECILARIGVAESEYTGGPTARRGTFTSSKGPTGTTR